MAKADDKTQTAGGGTGEEVSPPEEQFQMMNNPEVKKAIKQHISFMKAKESERRVINAEIAQSRSGLLDRGLSKAGLAYIESYSKMKDDKKRGMDATMVIGREAIGDPIQVEMFAKPVGRSRGGKGKKRSAKKTAAKQPDAQEQTSEDGSKAGESGEGYVPPPPPIH